MADDAPSQGYEHARRELPAFKTLGFGWQGARTFKPLLGGFVAFAIVAVFLAIRGGQAEVVDELTGQRLGGWSRPEDVHLLILVNAAIVVGLVVQFLAEFTRSWLALWMTLLFGAAFLSLRESGTVDDTTRDILLGLVLASAVAAVGVMLFDVVRHHRRRSGY